MRASILRLLLTGVSVMFYGCATFSPPPPTPIPIDAAVASNNTVIQWVRSPETVVFRADITPGGRENTLPSLREVPLCTIYGDSRVVWVNELGVFNTEVLIDRLDPDVIANFIVYLTVNERIYTYESPPMVVNEEDSGAVVETITIDVNGIRHTADGFSGWDSEWFSRVLEACRSLSSTPVLFEPTGGWLTVEQSPYDPNYPLLNWDASGGVDLAEIAASGSPRWLTGDAAVTFWRMQNSQSPRFLLGQGGNQYAVALQIPGISRTSPPPP